MKVDGALYPLIIHGPLGGYFWAEWRSSWRERWSAAAVGEVALGPGEAGAMDIAVRQPQSRGQRRSSATNQRRKRKRLRSRQVT